MYPLQGRVPDGVLCAQDYDRLAAQALDGPTYAYITGGTGQGRAARANRTAFARWAVVPRVLRDVRRGSLDVTLPGARLPHPVLLAPWAHHALVHPGAEVETARGAAAAGACLVASTLSSCTLEDIAAAAPSPRWFQLYFQPRRDVTRDLIRRAEDAGYTAMMLTVDAPVQVPSHVSQRAGFQWPAGCVAANLTGYPSPPPAEPATGRSRVFDRFMRGAPTWTDLAWVLEAASVPVWIKGVLHPADASALRAQGAAGVVVSNHGGRALDVAPPAVDVLPGIRAAVGDDYPLLVDGGIRSGADVFTAIALGADAVLIGRLQACALAVAGGLGVAHMVTLLREELEVAMALAGCGTLAEVRAATLRPASPDGVDQA